MAWNVDGAGEILLTGLQLFGVALTAHASRQLGVMDLAGLAQAANTPARPITVLRTGGYRLVRHPIYLGWVLMVWAAPEMTGTRLTFAAISTLYLAVAVPFEERSLRAALPGYTAYAKRVRWRMLPFVY
jgi:protein-S-isoprenylcysteine O-methyltransferase Ste14